MTQVFYEDLTKLSFNYHQICTLSRLLTKSITKKQKQKNIYNTCVILQARTIKCCKMLKAIKDRIKRKTVFRVSNQVQHKSSCAFTEYGKRLEILDLGSRGIVAKQKALISFAIKFASFVLSYAKSWFSHHVAHVSRIMRNHDFCIYMYMQKTKTQISSAPLSLLH